MALDADQLRRNVDRVVTVLTIHGSAPRPRVINVLRKLGLDEAEAEEVVAHGLTNGVLVEDGANLRTRGKP